jgi:hypothetical protein
MLKNMMNSLIEHEAINEHVRQKMRR